MTESKTKRERKPGRWVVLVAAEENPELWTQGRTIVANSAKAAIADIGNNLVTSAHRYVAIPERNWKPYTAEVPPTPQAILRPVKE